ncbi:MAG: pyruvate dehydrogenase complex dihydrolipoamide acetyltransferase [Undibacterium sp.]|nr:pyruvate dehydrogenase complex dihydrolipoamide acetyltransferase [Opitutaceae bacterium]
MANITLMPKLSDTMTVGTLVKWLKKEGDVIKTGDMLAEVETDKATMELESYFDGTILKIFSPAGSQLPVGAPLCAIGKPGENVDAPAPKAAPAAEAPAAPAAVQTPPRSAAPAPAPVAAPAPQAAAPEPIKSAAPAARVKISPLARKLAEEKRIDFTRVKGSGPGGRIVRADIIAAEKNPPPAAGKPAKADAGPSWGYRSVLDKGPVQAESFAPASNMRATIARRLTEAKNTIPHIYLDMEVDAGPLLALREQLNLGLSKDGVKLSVNDFVLKASAVALRAVAGVNTSWTGAGIQSHPAIHVSFAVALEDGLITPVIRDADAKTIFQISTEAKALGGRAKDKKLQPAEFTGGTFCVSNLGMTGVERFCAIINPPNAAILAVGATVKKPVVKGDEIVIGQRMTLTLSCDHRVVDGMLGAKFLNALKAHLESPSLLLL